MVHVSSYDTHCIVDALEHVDYSICTWNLRLVENHIIRVLDALDLYRPGL